jgi:hypothetical protein
MKPFCFVLMPFGKKADETGRAIDFDRIYAEIIKPAIEDAELEPIRADEETIGGIIHKPMFERLMLCDYAVADLTTANANVFYELGVRHGIRPHSTVLIFGKGMRLPFDVAPLRGLSYSINAVGAPEAPDEDRRALADRLTTCRDPVEDSPLFQLVTEWPRPDLARLKTDRFREVIEYSQLYKRKLQAARQSGASAVTKVENELNLRDADPGIVIDLFLSYRAVKAWQEMVDLASKMSPIVARTVLVREQLGLALNRLGRGQEAESVLLAVIDEHGGNSETNGILGRVYKDRWEAALKSGHVAAARSFLRKAIQSYLVGFEADWRDAYPGINALTLMEVDDPVDARRTELLPVVQYSVNRRLTTGTADYWDFAGQLELKVITGNQRAAELALGDVLTAVREKWEPETTARNLRLLREVRETRGVDAEWIRKLEAELELAAPTIS